MTDEQNIAINYSPLTGNIYAGRLNKARTAFLDGKRNVTHEVCAAVAEHVISRYGEGPDKGLVLTDNGVGWEITVKRVGEGRS